ncbi:DUF1902 domain-containing protein [Synechococcus sp. PCC 6312]|uniref:DUF1902 domain-containing protein n=1 Tax=Synechococcus sp. (strain ATCC 27167 / PCC 6312) TaxID=195253 RepID=UPI0003198720|nr:DUF1902 domain-containing protein [Synechococcus sp. PCC 6312]
MVNPHRYKVEAFWDQDAEVWIAQSEDVAGLVTESPTLEELTLKLKQMIPELLVANHLITPNTRQSITFELTTRREEYISVA